MKKHLSILVVLGIIAILAFTQIGLAQDVTLPEDAGYVDYSSDRSTIFFNTTGQYSDIIFFDFFYPFDTSLKLEYYDALAQYTMDYKAYVSEQGQWMVALDDLVKLYAPYLTYGIEGDTLTVRHILTTKTVHPEDSGLRSPRLNYTKYVWQASYSLSKAAPITVTRDTYVPFTTTAANGVVEGLAAAIVEKTEILVGFALSQVPTVKNGQLYVPVAEFMAALGKISAQEGDYLSIHTPIPNIPIASANNTYVGWQKITNKEITWADYMNGVLSGEIKYGHFWKAFYMGIEELYTGEGLNGESDPKETVVINRILPYNVYVPTTYDPNVPSKLLLLLHGGTGNENAAFERLSSRGLHIEDEADEHSYIVLSPNAWTRGPQWYKGAARFSFFKAIEMVCADYNIDHDRLLLCGNSAGGKGTWDLIVRYPEMFVACSVQAPASAFMDKLNAKDIALYRKRAAKVPVLFVNGAADVTIPFTLTSPWVYNVAKKVINAEKAYYVTIEEGHHSYAYGSALEIMYDFFDRALEGDKDPNYTFKTLTIVKGSKKAMLDGTPYTLNHAARVQQGKVLIALSDLQAIYGPDFYIYDVSAYNTNSEQTANVKLVMYENIAVNLKVGETFVRVDSELYKEDVPAENLAEVQANIFPTRTFSTPVMMVDSEVYVPAQELMAIFGKPVIVK